MGCLSNSLVFLLAKQSVFPPSFHCFTKWSETFVDWYVEQQGSAFESPVNISTQ